MACLPSYHLTVGQEDQGHLEMHESLSQKKSAFVYVKMWYVLVSSAERQNLNLKHIYELAVSLETKSDLATNIKL